MADIKQARAALESRILDGEARATSGRRRAAFDNTELPGPLGALLEKVARHAFEVTDEDMEAVKGGLAEDEVFELVVCAAVGQATRQYLAAIAALDVATNMDGSEHAPQGS